MIRPITAPIEEAFRHPTSRTPGRYEGLMLFAQKLGGLFGSTLKTWTVLDVGGADGWLGEMLVCAQYFLVDPRAPGALLFRPHRPVVGVAEGLPYRTAAVDLVVSKQTLPHFVHPALACREMLRVAREAVVIRQEFPSPDTSAFIAANPHARNHPEPQVPGYGPIGWPGHSRSQIDHPNDILDVLMARGVSAATYDGEDFLARRIR